MKLIKILSSLNYVCNKIASNLTIAFFSRVRNVNGQSTIAFPSELELDLEYI